MECIGLYLKQRIELPEAMLILIYGKREHKKDYLELQVLRTKNLN